MSMHKDYHDNMDYSTDQVDDLKTIVLIDGVNLYITAKENHVDIDYRKLLEKFRKTYNILRVYYFTTLVIYPESEENTHNSIQPLLDWLDYNGYSVLIKTINNGNSNSNYRKQRYGIEVDLATTALELVFNNPNIQRVILVSGSGSYVALVQTLQRRGIIVDILSSAEASIVADDLRRKADNFIEIGEWFEDITKPERENSKILEHNKA